MYLIKQWVETGYFRMLDLCDTLKIIHFLKKYRSIIGYVPSRKLNLMDNS